MNKKVKYMLFGSVFILFLIVVYLLAKAENNIVTQINYYDSGEIQSIIKQYKQSNKICTKYFFKNGNRMKKYCLINDEIDGLHYEYYESGELKNDVRYKNGRIVSKSTTYYKDGSVKATYSYNDNNIQDGLVHFYYINGDTKAINVFVNGHLYYYKTFVFGDTINFKEHIIPKITVNKNSFQFGDTLCVETQLYDLETVPYNSDELAVRYSFGKVIGANEKYQHPVNLVDSTWDETCYIMEDTSKRILYGIVYHSKNKDIERNSFFEFDFLHYSTNSNAMREN